MIEEADATQAVEARVLEMESLASWSESLVIDSITFIATRRCSGLFNVSPLARNILL